MLDVLFNVVGFLFLAAAVVAPCVEVSSAHRFPKLTILPSCVAIVVALLLFSVAD